MNEENLISSHDNAVKPRLAYIDNLKALLIIFVIIIHVAVTYSGIGSWFYIEHKRWFYTEHKTLDNISYYFFLFIELFNQAYFMSLFFMIAAYFIPLSLDKKGVKKFIIDRLFRLGIPTLIFIFLLFPTVAKIARPNIDILEFYKDKIISFSFVSRTGPMWFTLTLLIFSIIYIPIKHWLDKLAERFSFAINTKSVLGISSLIAIAAFSIRLIYPIGTSVMNLQFCFFAAYIFMFLIGIIAYRKNIFESISYQMAKKWFTAAFVFGIPLWILVIYFGTNRSSFQNSAILGGWNLPAFAYAFWESFFCVTIIIGLIGIFRTKFNTQNSLQKFLSANAFGAYVFHPIIVVTTSVLLKNVDIPLILKFTLVATITVPITFVLTSLIRRIQILQKLFS